MPYLVTLKAGLVDIVLPDQNRYQGGQTATLSDDQYGLLSTTAGAALFSSVVQQERPAFYDTMGVPSNSVGVSGDWAFDLGSKFLYGPRGTSGWNAVSQVPAPTGAGWTLSGFAALSSTDLYLTHAADGFGSGAAWYSTAQPTDGLDVTFTVEMSGGTGADGVTFALADPATATNFHGAGGGDLGLTGAVATGLALDTGSGSRARVVTTTASAMTTVATYGGALTLRPTPFTCRVTYSAGTMMAWINGTQIFTQAVSAPATARLGFTGANGGSTDNHIIRNVAFVQRGGVQLS